jgi:hypothetical protein
MTTNDPIPLNTEGPHSPEYTAQVAVTLAEAVRVLNYATRADTPGLEYPSDVYTLLGTLAAAIHGLPQLLAQVDAFLAAQYNTGRLRSDNGGSVAGLISAAGGELHYAEDYARALAARLNHAQSAVGHIAVEASDGG